MPPRALLAALVALLLVSAQNGLAASPTDSPQWPRNSTSVAHFTLGITGDVNLNPGVLKLSSDPGFVWGDLINITRSVDLMAIQHESTLAELNDPNPATIQFEDPLNYTQTYGTAGIGYITVANNHQFDYGYEGLNRTIATLDAIGIPHSGLGRSSAEVRTPKVVDHELPDGRTVQVAFFALVIDECWQWPNGSLYLDGCTCGPSANPTQKPPYQCYEANDTMPGLWYQFGIDDSLITELSSVVRAYKSSNPSHLIVVYLHVGPNFQWVPYSMHEYLLRNASAAGADIVWGTSSHHIQRFEVFKGRPIVYGMGDLMFRHVVGVEDWCPNYAIPCASYRPDLSIVYVFEIDASGPSGPVVHMGNITAFGTKHSDYQAGLIKSQSDSSWLVDTFNKMSIGATLIPTETLGRFRVSVNTKL